MTVRVYSARWILPITAPPIPHGAVAVEGHRIVWLGAAGDAPAGLRVDLGEAVLLPGLVNAHAHLELTAMRGFLEDLSFRHWILRLTKSREAVMTPEWRQASARLGIAEGLLAGTTTYGDVSDSGASLEAMNRMGVRGTMYHEVFGPDPARCGEAIGLLQERLATLRTQQGALTRVGVSPHAPYTVSDPLFSATAALARAESLPLTVHVAESAAEDALVRSGSGEFADAWRARGIPVAPRAASPIALLEACGVLGPQTLLVHAVRADAADVQRIAGSGSAVVHCPASNAKLGHGVAPVMEFMDAGIPIGLGTDSVASSNRMDLLDEARLATMQQRAVRQDPGALSAREVLALATLGGARALGLDGEVGSLEVGKSADLVAFAFDGVRDTPVYEPEEALVFGAAGRRPRLVVVAGRELVSDGALLVDVRDDVAAVREAAAGLQQFSRDAAS